MTDESQQIDAANEPAASSAPVLDAGTYEIIQKRLKDHAGELRGRLDQLDGLRRKVFGSIETVLLHADRITTEHNCIPRDMVPIGKDVFLFGYNVQFGLKTSIQLTDVFTAFKYDSGHFTEIPLDLINHPQFVQDFQSLYKYYKNTVFVKFSYIGPFLFMVFRVGQDVTDVKTFKWAVDGGTLTYVDNRSDHEFKYPPQYQFDWKRTHRELHRSGLHPHISIDDRVFVECVSGDLTVKIEDNTETGEGIYSEEVEFKDQTLDDAEIYFAICGNLILLKIRPFQEKAFRYFVYNDKIKQVRRVDGIADACVLLPEDQGIIFSNGYYLQTGVLKIFESERTNMMFERVIRSSNGEDYLYVFYNRREGDYVLMSYNLIRQTVENPIWCNGFSLFENGHLVYFKHQGEPVKHHTVQIWQTAFVAVGFEQQADLDSFLFKIGNRDVVRCMAECQDVLNLLAKDESYSGLYVDIVKLTADIAESYFWVDQAEAFNLKEILLQIRETAGKAIDEHQKVLRIRQETNTELKRVSSRASDLFAKLQREEIKSVDQFVSRLSELRQLRGETISLKQLRYIDLEKVGEMENTIADQNNRLSQDCVGFLLRPEALDPYRDRVKEQKSLIDTLKKVADGRALQEGVAQTGADLELLIEITTNLKIDDPTETTRIIDSITVIYTSLNQVKGALKNKIQSLAQTEGAAQFDAELKLLNQSVINYLDICDAPAKCEEYLNKVMVQFEELEGRFSDFDDYVVQLADKRTEVYEAFEARKLALVEARNRRVTALMASADRVLKVVQNRVEGMKTINDINGYMAADLMIDKVRSIIGQLTELEDTVKADDLQSRLKSIQQDAVRQLKDKLELFADGDNVIQLGQHKFFTNSQQLDLTILHREKDLFLHLTGTRYFEKITDENVLATRDVWDQEIVSENRGVYRSEYLAREILAELEAGQGSALDRFIDLTADARLEHVQKFMAPRYAEGYIKGIHDDDAVAILSELCRIQSALGLARYQPAARCCAMVYWLRFCEEQTRQLWTAKLKGLGVRNRFFAARDGNQVFIDPLKKLIGGFIEQTGLHESSVVDEAAAYLFHQVSQSDGFVISKEAEQLYEAFNEYLLTKHARKDFDDSRAGVKEHPVSDLQLIRDWLQGFLDAHPDSNGARYLDEVAGFILCDNFDPRFLVEESSHVEIKGMRGGHARIEDGIYQLDYLEFIPRLESFRTTQVPRYHQFHELKKQVIEKAREDLRLSEFKPRVLTSFVRNRLIDNVYLHLIGDNLAKQIGAAGDKKRTDLMGLLLLVSPPGYGKTTLMEYIANRLGVVFMKINGPALGHRVTSLDPEEANNAAAREEIMKLNLAFEMGDNVMIYLDDIQHCNPELLQKFISLCDAQRKIEGVFRGKSQTYDLRGRKVIVVMAGNPYTESGEKFRIPDMLANRADTYNLGDILGSHADAFKMSYLENAVTSNPVLQQLANKSQKDIQKFIEIAASGSRDSINFEATYAAEEVNEIVNVLQKLLHIRDAVLGVNQQYIASAAQSDDYRTEPAFKLQGSYRNMNRMAEKVLPIMNDDEVKALVMDHYENESQTLTSGAEANMLKFKELMGVMNEDEAARWSEIKKTFKRKQVMGGADETDPVSRVVAQLSMFGEGLGDIRETLSKALDSPRPAPTISLPEMKPEIHVDLQPLAQQVSYFTNGLDAIKDLLAEQESTPAAKDDGLGAKHAEQIAGRIDAVNSDLNEIRELIRAYREEQKVSREASEQEIETRALDFSSISVTQSTLKQIYDLIDRDEKANQKKKVKLPKKEE